MNLEESRRHLTRQQALIDTLKPRSRGQLAIIDALRGSAQQLDALHTLADLLDRQLRAKWRQLEQLQAAFASVVTEQRRPSHGLEEDTAEIELTEVDPEVPPALRLTPVLPE